MTNSQKSLVMQVAYVVFACMTIWIMVDWLWYGSSADHRINGQLLIDLVLIAWSTYMFGSGCVAVIRASGRNEVPERLTHRSAAIRIFLAILLGVGAQWFFIQAMFEYLN